MNNFDKYCRSAKKSIFRLEGRAEYRAPGEQENIAQWKQGKLDLDSNKLCQQWMASLKNAKTKKIAVQRVRVAPKPLSDYIKFEIDVWRKYSSQNGEKFLFLECGEYQKIIAGLGFNPKDFWLFDDKTLLIFNYDKTGQFSGEILITDGEMIRRYSDLKYKLLQKSVPVGSFLKNN
jgi:hypothetical protein